MLSNTKQISSGYQWSLCQKIQQMAINKIAELEYHQVCRSRKSFPVDRKYQHLKVAAVARDTCLRLHWEQTSALLNAPVLPQTSMSYSPAVSSYQPNVSSLAAAPPSPAPLPVDAVASPFAQPIASPPVHPINPLSAALPVSPQLGALPSNRFEGPAVPSGLHPQSVAYSAPSPSPPQFMAPLSPLLFSPDALSPAGYPLHSAYLEPCPPVTVAPIPPSLPPVMDASGSCVYYASDPAVAFAGTPPSSPYLGYPAYPAFNSPRHMGDVAIMPSDPLLQSPAMYYLSYGFQPVVSTGYDASFMPAMSISPQYPAGTYVLSGPVGYFHPTGVPAPAQADLGLSYGVPTLAQPIPEPYPPQAYGALIPEPMQHEPVAQPPVPSESTVPDDEILAASKVDDSGDDRINEKGDGKHADKTGYRPPTPISPEITQSEVSSSPNGSPPTADASVSTACAIAHTGPVPSLPSPPSLLSSPSALQLFHCPSETTSASPVEMHSGVKRRHLVDPATACAVANKKTRLPDP
ncbi:uncharacterized protein BJ171DRAFT_472421 [Polychytrium aggregatum]|uniref:uncharacterized protein n=1 Tax=Polychytrium aggregatum TaxID=110093 RepID=UPI0022FDDBF5|nr:uncharacterized protein BJ171DRAFT_472421 [Polychytrium aggregatum]KAI9207544.1 hypothetical protein BJ171DRAFT_472421 [Polychytrium aggregatum]